jgi:hypothetical protein
MNAWSSPEQEHVSVDRAVRHVEYIVAGAHIENVGQDVAIDEDVVAIAQRHGLVDAPVVEEEVARRAVAGNPLHHPGFAIDDKIQPVAGQCNAAVERAEVVDEVP